MAHPKWHKMGLRQIQAYAKTWKTGDDTKPKTLDDFDWYQGGNKRTGIVYRWIRK